MTLSGPKLLRLAAGLCLGIGMPAPLIAQVPTVPSNTPPIRPRVVMMPPTPVLKSPVDLFRELLAMTPVERRQALTNRPPEVRKRILAKLREYQTLKPEERELRLRVTELQWYLLPLMSVPGTNRAAQVAMIPEDIRKLVEQRLNRWDLLPPPMQEELLNNEMTARYFTQFQTETNASEVLSRMSPARRAKLEAGLDHWRSLSEEERRKTLEGFNEFFELTPAEKKKALDTLSEAERQQMEKTLQAYGKLSPAQRIQCTSSFEKFTGMTLAERQQFLKNAERWKLMSPSERQTWRELVSMAPLMPSQRLLPPLPPQPPLPGRQPRRAVATNSP